MQSYCYQISLFYPTLIDFNIKNMSKFDISKNNQKTEKCDCVPREGSWGKIKLEGKQRKFKRENYHYL